MAESLGRRVRAARVGKGWTQVELGKRIGVDRKTIGEWERTGVIPSGRFPALERYLDLDFSVNITQTGERTYVWTRDTRADDTLTGRVRQLRRSMRRLRSELEDVRSELDELLDLLDRTDPGNGTAP